MSKVLTKKVLHLTPHLGGGVGRVLLSYLTKAQGRSFFTHQIACLDYANDSALAKAENLALDMVDKMSLKKKDLLGFIAEADIVLIHWWNHPLLYDFLVRTVLPPCRLALWSHISGFHPPYVFTEKILNYPDIFVCTTPLSLQTEEVDNLKDEQKKHLRVVWSTGGVEHVKAVKPRKHAGFNIGYIGTVDYAKLHPNFLKMCGKINIPEVKFVVCGGPNEKEIKQETGKLGLAEKFDFTGPVNDITKYLALFDIFGYPLSPSHYGTCDQVLQESMAAGVVPVVLPNRMEKYMVKHGFTGLVAKDEKDYVRAIQKLHRNKDLRNKLSKNAKEYAVKTFTASKTVQDWKNIFEEALTLPKTVKKWDREEKSKISAAEIFLESLGSYGQNFNSYLQARTVREREGAEKRIKKLAESKVWRSETRGTTHHYHSFFPKDRHLSLWSQLMKEAGKQKS